jgi:hypothetical protein
MGYEIMNDRLVKRKAIERRLYFEKTIVSGRVAYRFDNHGNFPGFC